MRPDTKILRATAASVAGARNAGVETAASSAARDILAAAETTLAAMAERAEALEPSAPDQEAEAAYGRAAEAAIAYAAAVAVLRDALGIAPPDTTPQKAAPPAAADTPAALPEERQDRSERAAAFAAEFAAAIPKTTCRFGECYDYRGQRVALISRYRLTESRSSILGYSPGGEVFDEEFFLVAEDGRRLKRGEFVAARGGWDRCYLGGNQLRICGMNGVPSPEITADWIPTAAAEPRRFPDNRAPDRFYSETDLTGWWQAALEDAEKSAEAARLDAARTTRMARAAASDAAHRAANHPFAALNALLTR